MSKDDTMTSSEAAFGWLVMAASTVGSLWLVTTAAKHLFDAPTVWHVGTLMLLSSASIGRTVTEATKSLKGFTALIGRPICYWLAVGVLAAFLFVAEALFL